MSTNLESPILTNQQQNSIPPTLIDFSPQHPPQEVYEQHPLQTSLIQLPDDHHHRKTSLNTPLPPKDLNGVFRPQQSTIQLCQQNNPMLPNQLNLLPLIDKNKQQVTIEQSITFSIKLSCPVMVKLLIDLFIFTRILSYQYGLIIYFVRDSIINVIETELLHWFHVALSVNFIWANLGCG